MTRSLLFLHAKAGRRPELLRVLERLGVLTAASEQPGFLGIEVAVPADDEDELLLIESWASRELYDRWSAGPEAARWHDEIAELLVGPPQVRVYHIAEAVR